MHNCRNLEYILIYYAHANLAQEPTAEITLLKLLSALTLACDTETMKITSADKLRINCYMEKSVFN